ncbi:tyrosine--tRNA ligase [Fusibacter tunisiensis]|uniref:Tyrosine--tRNA ligase n=1 Tax=Fusibacter tunisiensis TaxID=1008308 RepID=A0ABS2MP99_9FIRM|nr:tyrosine--tRNA ligase [Fusibacter tunisiensis]MBM7561232.1 tyrosyl-tRNA synthetase [Fusibacter tunisiensis]
MKSVYDVLMERGYIEQITHEEEVKALLEKERVTFYIGFDPTADSLHLGHFIQIMVMMHMQNAGHRPIALIGGGTAKIGDPSGKTDMRKMLTPETIVENGNALQKQMEKYLNLDGENGFVANNAKWLDELKYIPFIREIGSKFSVNRMLTAECFKQRLEKGLSFLEFNYMIMQAYDFLELNRELGCQMQLGGNDQWSNIIAGVDLVRRMESNQVYGLTFKLLLTSDGKKMGKTESGAIWMDPEKTSPYELFQYLRNIEDADVENCLKLLTFLPMDEVRELSALEGSEINRAKEVLAYEFTKIVHGEEAAEQSLETARSLFSNGTKNENMPTTEMKTELFEAGMGILDVMLEIGLIPSKGEGRRLIQQNGVAINDSVVTDFARTLDISDFESGDVVIRKGKKVFHRIKLI